MSWQPIETAPRTEEQELLVCSCEGGWYYCEVVTWVTWADEGNGGWFNGDVSHGAIHYTHWMPIPAPPAPSDGDRKPETACSVVD